MPQFSKKIPTALHDVIGRIKINETGKKGLAIEYALHLARLKPDHKVKAYGSGEDHPCNLGLEKEELDLFRSFRTNHSPVLSDQTNFFDTTVRLGCSVYEAGYRLSATKDFATATLVSPPSEAPPSLASGGATEGGETPLPVPNGEAGKAVLSQPDGSPKKKPGAVEHTPKDEQPG